MAKGRNGGGFKEGKRSRPARGGELDPTQEELQRVLAAQTSSPKAPPPTEVPPKDKDIAPTLEVPPEVREHEAEVQEKIEEKVDKRIAAEQAPVNRNAKIKPPQIRTQRFVPRSSRMGNYDEDGRPAIQPDTRVYSEEPEIKKESELSRKPSKKRTRPIAFEPDTSDFSVQVETKPGRTWTEPEPQVPVGRKRARKVFNASTEPPTQVETKTMQNAEVKPPQKPDFKKKPIAEAVSAAYAKALKGEAEENALIDKNIATGKPNPDEDEEYPAVWRYNRDRRGNDEAQIEPEQIEDVSPKVEGTPKEWREKLRELIEGAKEKVGTSERSERMKAYLAERSKVLGEKAKEYGANPEKLIRDMGEQYNKLSFKQKLLFGFSAGAGATIFAGVSTPLTLLFAGGLGIQRAGGMASMYLKFEKHLQDTAEGKSKGILGRQEWYKKIFEGSSEKQRKVIAAIMSVGYTAGTSAAIGGTIKFASESQYGEAVHDWLRNHYPFGEAGASATGASATGASATGAAATDAAPTPALAESGMGADVPHAAAEVATPEHPAIPIGHQASADVQYQAMRAVETGHQASANVQAAVLRATESNATAALPEMPSVDVQATPGHGYEWMLKRVWEDLHNKNVELPKGVDPDSDLGQLLKIQPGDKTGIDKLVHDMALKHNFFNQAGETSVQIDPSAHMTIGAGGQLHFGDAMHGDMVNATEAIRAHVTPAYHPEAPVAPVAEPLPNVTPAEAADGIVIKEIPTKEIVSPEPITMVDRTNVPEFVSEPHTEASSADATEVAATQAPAPVVEQGFISNQFDLKIPVAEPHIYSGSNGALFAYGGSSTERLGTIMEYLKQNPGKVVISGDSSGENRIPWGLIDGKLVPGEMMQTRGFLGFLSDWMKPPEPNELEKLIK